ncbi:MAG TPA: FAD-dependent monooxygenase [Burkholderiaceae bacterium]|nr:FAD-dependent monooxygenase [Burkholderiaceae bacterium]
MTQPDRERSDATRAVPARTDAAATDTAAGFGIVIDGDGPVGLALALFLLREGLPAADIELPATRGEPPGWLAARPLALGHGTWQLLSRIVPLPPAAPIRRIEVSLEGRAGRTHLDARDAGVPALGQVIRHRDLVAALRSALRGHRFASAAGPAPQTGDAVRVHADGDTGADARERSFDQHAVLAELNTGLADTGTAFERFTAEGPLAMLPLPEAGRYALVWCGTPQDAERRLALSEAGFIDELSGRLGGRFGALSLAGPRAAAPLVRKARAQTVAGRDVWIGNAAQALHPVAGQGLNLGLRDAFVLARCLGDARAGEATIAAAAAALQRYRRERRFDRQALLGITDTLAAMCTLRPLRPLQSVALAALDLAAPARQTFAARLMYGFR